MDNGISARALRYWETKQAVSANNLANLSTPGFKAERVFAQLLDEASLTARSMTDFSEGALNPTGRPLDVALVGDGFIVLQTDEGPRWSRGGSLSLTADGVLVDGAGHALVGEHGDIVLPSGGAIEITQGGEVLVDGSLVDRLVLQRSTVAGGPERAGGNLWIPTAQSERVPAGALVLKQGHLEESNVDAVGAMVEMIEIQRAYQAVQRSMITQDEAHHTITAQVGRLS